VALAFLVNIENTAIKTTIAINECIFLSIKAIITYIFLYQKSPLRGFPA
jgi:hypothetical protein